MARTGRRVGKSWAGRAMVETLESRTLFSVYYVSPTGNDAGAGGVSAPWKTLQKAADVVVAGDTVHVLAGTYAGFELGWSGPQNGTAGNPITFVADSGVLINSCNSRTADGIDLEGASYVTIKGFTINNTTGTIMRAGIRSVTNNHAVIENNNVNGAGDWGIFTGFSDDVLIQDNVASNSVTQHGIYVSNSGDRPVIRGNVVFGNHNCGIHMNGDVSQGGDGIISDALVEDNVIYDNGVNGGSAINADGVQDSVFRNNLLYGNLASGISLFMEDGAAGSIGNVVENNTIIMAPGSRWAINIVNGSTGNAVFNNILDNQNTGHGAINIAADSLSGFTSDYNVIISNRFSPDDGGTMETLSQWQTATGQDRHSILGTERTVFANAGADNFHLMAGSLAVDAADATYAPAADIDGNARPSGGAADIGAYELVQGAPVVPPVVPPVVKAATTAGLSASTGVSGMGDRVTFTVMIGVTGGGTATGTVTFFDGVTAIGACALDGSGTAVFATAGLSPGMHSIMAIYSGDGYYAASGTGAAAMMVIAGEAGNQNGGAEAAMAVEAPVADQVVVVDSSTPVQKIVMSGAVAPIAATSQAAPDSNVASQGDLLPAEKSEQRIVVAGDDVGSESDEWITG